MVVCDFGFTWLMSRLSNYCFILDLKRFMSLFNLSILIFSNLPCLVLNAVVFL